MLWCNSNRNFAHSVASKTEKKAKGDFSLNICSKHKAIDFFFAFHIEELQIFRKKNERVCIQKTIQYFHNLSRKVQV